MREVITRYGRHNIGFLWLFLEPILFTCGIATLWTLTKATHGSKLPIVAFAVTGYSSILLWRNSSNRCVGAVQPNLDLLYHRNVTIFDVFIARIALEVMGATVSCVLLTLFFCGIGWMSPPADILTALIGWSALCSFAVALALLIGGLSERGEIIDRTWHIITYLLFPLSGAGFLVEWLPLNFQVYVSYLPMVHGVEMLRHGYFGDTIHPKYNMAYAMTVTSLLLFAGILLIRQMKGRAQLQ
jgi:capsular polysaccharide transport system permease protein